MISAYLFIDQICKVNISEEITFTLEEIEPGNSEL